MNVKQLFLYGTVLTIFVICKVASNSEWVLGSRYILKATESLSAAAFFLIVYGISMRIHALRQKSLTTILTLGCTFIAIEVFNSIIRNEIFIHIFLSILLSILLALLINSKSEHFKKGWNIQ